MKLVIERWRDRWYGAVLIHKKGEVSLYKARYSNKFWYVVKIFDIRNFWKGFLLERKRNKIGG